MLILNGLQFFASSKSFAQTSTTAYVFTETASLWDKPGYSWKVCGQLQQPNSFKTLDSLMETNVNCTQGRKYLHAGDPVEVLLKNNKPEEMIKNVTANGVTQKVKFYHVSVNLILMDGSELNQKGWISADQISDPKVEAPPQKQPVAKPNCPPKKDPLKDASKDARSIEDHLANQMALGDVKSNREIDHFACLYRRRTIDDKQFDDMIPDFRKAAKKAETSFKIPYAVTMCTMLIESGLYYNSSESDEYKGLGQFGSAIVEDLSKLSTNTKSPYSKMWDNYSSSSLTDRAVRNSDDPEVATGAVAMMLRWLYQDRLPASRCKDCSTDGKLNRRDLFLMVAGYNYSPYALDKIANRSLAAMHSSFPPPQETRDYMTQMDRCLEKGQEKKFRVGKDDKNEEISHEYKDRKASCDKNHPS